MLDAIFSWNTIWYALLTIYIVACLGLIVIVLLQKGKGSGFAGAFGAGAGPGAEAVFGPKSGQSLPVKLTYAAAALFMVIAMIMSIIANQVSASNAPELAEDDGTSLQSETLFEEYGLGTGVVDPDRYSGTPAPVEAPEDEASEDESPTPTANTVGEPETEDTPVTEDAPEPESN